MATIFRTYLTLLSDRNAAQLYSDDEFALLRAAHDALDADRGAMSADLAAKARAALQAWREHSGRTQLPPRPPRVYPTKCMVIGCRPGVSEVL